MTSRRSTHSLGNQQQPRTFVQPFFNKCSLRLTMTAVICWSMKMRMVANRAGMMAAAIAQFAFLKGSITQPRSAAFVGWQKAFVIVFNQIQPYISQFEGRSPSVRHAIAIQCRYTLYSAIQCNQSYWHCRELLYCQHVTIIWDIQFNSILTSNL